MARLTRKNIKVFADSASNNGVFGSLQAGNPTVSNDVETLQSLTAWDYGWNSATMTSEKLPPLEEIQGVTYVTTYQQAYLMQEGMPEWASTVTYYKGSLVKKVTTTGFQIYNSLTDDNTNNQLSDTSNWKLVMDSDNLYALDSTVVHKAGDETITGEKTFTAKISTASLELYPNIGGTRPYIDFHYDNSSSDYTSRIIENTSGELTLQADKVYVPTSTQTTSKSSTEDANIAWVNSTGNNVVHLDSNETITGLKTIRRSVDGNNTITMLDLVNNSITNGTNPSSNSHTRIYFSDKDAYATACIYNNFESNGENGIVLQALKSETVTPNLTRSLTQLGLYYPATGNPYATAPASDVNGSIVTTVNKSKAANGYFKLGNGMIVQWGKTANLTNNASSPTSTTFPTAFTSTNYRVMLTVEANSGNNEYALTVLSKTTTSFSAILRSYEGGAPNKPAAYIAIGY